MIWGFILVVVFFPPYIKAEHIGNMFFPIGFGWGSLSRVDKENDEGKEQTDFISLACESTEMLLQHLLFLPFESQLITNYSITTSVVEFNKQFTFSKGFIFLNGIHTSRSLRT